MFIKTCCAIPATRWAGLRDVYGSRLSGCSNYLLNFTKPSSNTPFRRLLGPPEIHHLKICPSDNAANPPLYPPQFPVIVGIDNRHSFPYPCLDVFFRFSYDHPIFRCRFDLWLNYSWDHDPLTTLRLVGYMKQRSRAMKHGRELFYIAALWLHSYHPKTLAHNVQVLSKLGCLKDWLEILYRLVNGPLVRKKEFIERNSVRGERHLKLLQKRVGQATQQVEQDEVCSRDERRIRMARRAIEMYNFDPNYRLLFDKISDLFAGLLKSDLEFLDSGDFGKISLASKWCPSIDSSYDRSTLICESIARRLFPYDLSPEYRGIEEAHYAYRVRHRLQKQVLVPLRRALKLPEIYMSSNEWNSLPYDRVSINALRTHWRLFTKHDEERFMQYINDKYAKKQHRRKPTIPSDTKMFPHDILRLLDFGYGWEAVETQWQRMVEAFSLKGKFKNCIVSCGNNSFQVVPELYKNFTVSFQLLVSDLSESPWKGNILREVCHGKAEFSKIEGDDLESKMGYLRYLYEGVETMTVWPLIDKILEVAVDHNISREKMVRRIFVVSPNLIDHCMLNKYMEAARKKYEECGYVMPNIVIWGTGIQSDVLEWKQMYSNDEIVTIEGSSLRFMELFLEQDGKVEEYGTFRSLISDEEYKELKVLD